MSAFAEENDTEKELQQQVDNHDNDNNSYDDDGGEDDYYSEDIDTDWVFSSVRRPVDVYLPDEDKWYAATLLRVVDAIDRLALITYDDEDFADETVPFEDLRPGTLPSKKRQKEKKAAEKKAAAAAAATASASASAAQTATAINTVNDVKFRRYLTDLVLGEDYSPASWQPSFERASVPMIDQLLAYFASFTTQNNLTDQINRADLQEFDRSLHQSRTSLDCFLFKDECYMVQIPLHLPPIVYAPGHFVDKKQQEKQAAARRTQLRIGYFLLKKDCSEVMQVLSEEEYFQNLSYSETCKALNLLTFASTTGAMPLPTKEPHNQSNKSAVLIARVLHAIDQWNEQHLSDGEQQLELFCVPVKKNDSEEEITASSTTYSTSPIEATQRAREDVLIQALNHNCHRIVSHIYYTSTSTFHVSYQRQHETSNQKHNAWAMTHCHRTHLSFTEWQDVLRRQRAHQNEDAHSENNHGTKTRSDSVMSAVSDSTTNTNTNTKSRSSSIVDPVPMTSKSRSGSIVNPNEGLATVSTSTVNGGGKSRSGSAVDTDLHKAVHSKGAHSKGSVNNSASSASGSDKTVEKVKLNSRAARRAAEEEEEELEAKIAALALSAGEDDKDGDENIAKTGGKEIGNGKHAKKQPSAKK